MLRRPIGWARQGCAARSVWGGGGAIGGSSVIAAGAAEDFPQAIRLAESAIDEGKAREKLEALKRLGVTRVSINPQTMNDETLRRVGRAHTAADAERAYWLAREVGFDSINMDLIAGLPGETAADMRDSC